MLLFQRFLFGCLFLPNIATGAGSLSHVFKRVKKSPVSRFPASEHVSDHGGDFRINLGSVEAPSSGNKPPTGTGKTGLKPGGSKMSKTEVSNYIMVLKKKFEVLGISLDNYFTNNNDVTTVSPTDEDDCLTNEPSEKVEKPTSNIPAILARLREFITIDSPLDHPMSADIPQASDHGTDNLSDIDKLKLEVMRFFQNNPTVEDMFKEDESSTTNDATLSTLTDQETESENNTYTTSTPTPTIVTSSLTGETSYEILAASPNEVEQAYSYYESPSRHRHKRRRYKSRRRKSRSRSTVVHKSRSKTVLKVRKSPRAVRRKRPQSRSRKRHYSRRRIRFNRLKNKKNKDNKNKPEKKTKEKETKKKQCPTKKEKAKVKDTSSTENSKDEETSDSNKDNVKTDSTSNEGSSSSISISSEGSSSSSSSSSEEDGRSASPRRRRPKFHRQYRYYEKYLRYHEKYLKYKLKYIQCYRSSKRNKNKSQKLDGEDDDDDVGHGKGNDDTDIRKWRASKSRDKASKPRDNKKDSSEGGDDVSNGKKSDNGNDGKDDDKDLYDYSDENDMGYDDYLFHTDYGDFDFDYGDESSDGYSDESSQYYGSSEEEESDADVSKGSDSGEESLSKSEEEISGEEKDDNDGDIDNTASKGTDEELDHSDVSYSGNLR